MFIVSVVVVFVVSFPMHLGGIQVAKGDKRVKYNKNIAVSHKNH